ncbi:MAG: UDP-N-acetylmuramate--L-alanine ligase [Nocardioides sp.]|nr:UDP-N-acetylmuramate--L-alanine ligase [Nocardioides sp.]
MADAPSVPPAFGHHVHLVGIGGAGLSAIARVLLARGHAVSGSDGADSATLAALRGLGATTYVGHDAAQLGDADSVVVSAAVPATNPELAAAHERGVPVLKRSAAMAALMRDSRAVTVAGTHGKTTTTSLLTVALQAAGASPTYTIGGDLAASGTNAEVGESDLFVAEADESDGAFLHYVPHVAVVTNVEADHLDHWGSEEAYTAAFAQFAARVEPGGALVLCADDAQAAALAGSAVDGVTVLTAGTAADADLRATEVVLEGTTSAFTATWHGEELGRVVLRIPGRHYVLDAALALAAGLHLGLAFDDLRRGLEAYTGTRRRMERKGEAAGVRVYDSYAHHPAEIAGDLVAGRSVAGEGRLVVAFQPHLVSRTRLFGARMGEALGAADEVVVLDVYVAREAADPEVTGALVADAVPLPDGLVAAVAGIEEAAVELAARARPGDLVLTLGAGDVTRVGPRVLELLEQQGAGVGED